jgi:hypothetical protein
VIRFASAMTPDHSLPETPMSQWTLPRLALASLVCCALAGPVCGAPIDPSQAESLVASAEQYVRSVSPEASARRDVLESFLQSTGMTTGLASKERERLVSALEANLLVTASSASRDARLALARLAEEASGSALRVFLAWLQEVSIPAGAGVLVYLLLLTLARHQSR